MSRWISLSADDLKAAGHGAIVERAQTIAVGTTNPVVEALASAVARVRRAVAAANPLDADPTKVPVSLKSVAVRLALYALMERIGLPLGEDRRETRRTDFADLERLADRRLLVELPDQIDPEATPGNRGNWNSERRLSGRTTPLNAGPDITPNHQ